MTTAYKTKQARPASVYLLMVLLLFQGVGAVFGGYSLVADPSGGILQMPLSALDGTPFSSYLIPGLILLLVLGVFPLVTVAGLWLRPSLPWLAGLERLVHLHGAWLASFTIGVALIIWISVQGMMIGLEHLLQWSYLVLGFVIIGISLLPSVRRHYAQPQAASRPTAMSQP
jgi:hypothetical protein